MFSTQYPTQSACHCAGLDEAEMAVCDPHRWHKERGAHCGYLECGHCYPLAFRNEGYAEFETGKVKSARSIES